MKIEEQIDRLQRGIDTLEKVKYFADNHKITGTDVNFLYQDFIDLYGKIINRRSFLRLISQTYELKMIQTVICGRRCYVYESKGISSTD